MDNKEVELALYNLERLNQKYETFKLESKVGNKILTIDTLKSIEDDTGIYLILNTLKHNHSYLAIYYHKTFNVDDLIFKDTGSTTFYFKKLKYLGIGYQKYILNKKEHIPYLSNEIFSSSSYGKEWYCYYLTEEEKIPNK